MVNVAINGFGRIGRLFFRAAFHDKKISIAAVNDITEPATLAHLLKFDSVHGKFPAKVTSGADHIMVDGKKIMVYSEKEPEKLPWKQHKIDVVVESTGKFTKKAEAEKHIKAGAKKVLISAPAKDPVDLTLVRGVNDQMYDKARHHVISNASCTTNSLAPAVFVLHKNFGVKQGFLTTVHAYTNDQQILDLPHKDLRRARSAGINIIPTTTGAAKSVAEVIPELKGKLDGISIRVPVACGSVTDFVCEVGKDVTKEKVNGAFKEAAGSYMKNIIEYSEEPLVSTDIIGNPASSIFDSQMTNVIGTRFVKILTWYDNEWGFSVRMVEVVRNMI